MLKACKSQTLKLRFLRSEILRVKVQSKSIIFLHRDHFVPSLQLDLQNCFLNFPTSSIKVFAIMNAIVFWVSFAAILLQVKAMSPTQQQEILKAHNEKRKLVPEGTLVRTYF